ncbi:Integrase [Pseudomonas sp. 9AZ]|uniref:integrase n=1 Tax=Pseudomonas sp. 9AZ TaxID=2653168 RepID=UPI0012F0822C|nr:integrase [Pseudomonas sp. 9AZ]VXC39218.1 Integrase [Pseudomonas sp. 9AZ]
MKPEERRHYYVELYSIDHVECRRILASKPIEDLILRCTNDRRIDIGAVCYAERNTKTRVYPKPVNKASLRPERASRILLWCIDLLSRYFTGASAYTTYCKACELINFVDWCDDNKLSHLFESASAYKEAIDLYTQNLLIRIKDSNGIKAFTANRLQSEALRSGRIFFPSTEINFLSDLPIISNSNSDEEQTDTPSEAAIAAHLTACQYLFDGLSEFILEGLDFPHSIPFNLTNAILLPAEYTITTEEIIQETPKIQASIFWDYTKGAINSLSECIARTSQQEYHVARQRNEALGTLKNANDDPRHPKRMWLAKFAQDAFISLFAANSGLNESSIRNLEPLSGKYTNSDNAGFVITKARAAGREIEIEIQKTFKKQLNKFLKLREYICTNNNHPYLFVKITNGEPIRQPIKSVTIGNFNDQIRRFLDPNFQGLSYRKLRKYKSVYLLGRNHPIPVVAAIMQSSVRTVAKRYSLAEEKKAIDEISTMLTHLISILDAPKELDTPAGECSGPQTPKAVGTPPVAHTPNCKDFIGCVFCSEFRLHANEASVRKLLSMRYVTNAYLTACSTEQQFHNVHGESILQIDRILDELKKARPQMKRVISAIQKDIDEKFKLTEYWLRTYERLIKTKVIE